MRPVGFEQNINDQPNIQQPAQNQGVQSLIRRAWDRINVSQIIPNHYIANFVSVAPTLYILGYWFRVFKHFDVKNPSYLPMIYETGPTITSVIFAIANIAATYIVAKQDFNVAFSRFDVGDGHNVLKMLLLAQSFAAMLGDWGLLLDPANSRYVKSDDHFDRKFFSGNYHEILTSKFKQYPYWSLSKYPYEKWAPQCDKDYVMSITAQTCKQMGIFLKQIMNDQIKLGNYED